jgi:hypothetical protein
LNFALLKSQKKKFPIYLNDMAEANQIHFTGPQTKNCGGQSENCMCQQLMGMSVNVSGSSWEQGSGQFKRRDGKNSLKVQGLTSKSWMKGM